MISTHSESDWLVVSQRLVKSQSETKIWTLSVSSFVSVLTDSSCSRDCQQWAVHLGPLRSCKVVLDFFVLAFTENLENWFYGIVPHCLHLGSRILKYPFLLFWLHFRILLPAALSVLIPVAQCSSGYYFQLLLWVLLPAALPVLFPVPLLGKWKGYSYAFPLRNKLSAEDCSFL